MSETKNTDQRQSVPTRFFGWCISVTWRLAFWLFVAFLISVLIEWVGIVVGWWSSDHSYLMLNQEIAYLVGYDNSVYGVPPSVLALNMIDKARTLGIDQWIELFKSLGGAFSTAASSAINILLLLLVRLSIIACTLPAFFLIGLVAFVDGLTERDVRRSCGGLESSWIYHFAKPLILPAFILGAAIYLTCPVSINPAYVFAPAMIITGMAVYVTSSKFKLYA